MTSVLDRRQTKRLLPLIAPLDRGQIRRFDMALELTFRHATERKVTHAFVLSSGVTIKRLCHPDARVKQYLATSTLLPEYAVWFLLEDGKVVYNASNKVHHDLVVLGPLIKRT